ncbi:DUF1488 domain-containing protein [Vibrio algivorus]|uniref:Transcriptional regulator n=1 Tax=Vibrio algivorus TaxID=1667024 RepID=A0ABQ6EKC4_9VIBR|nr:DUF1488 domain-containing protein [Vibrio algivorus]GLT13352.1 transcriptional regulator [Vibrio algivorus]
MNQNILFVDRYEWDCERQAVVFQAQQAGQLIDCIVSLGLLSQLDNANVSKENALAVFERVRFDLEDIAEQAIEKEEFSPTGEIVLG